jgi:hypothetical protein
LKSRIPETTSEHSKSKQSEYSYFKSIAGTISERSIKGVAITLKGLASEVIIREGRLDFQGGVLSDPNSSRFTKSEFSVSQKPLKNQDCFTPNW